MQPLFDEYGVTVVALSKDTPELAQAHHERDGLKFDLLCDPDLSIIKRFGLLHEGAAEFATFYLPGNFPLGYPVGFKQMAIPTTLLLDEQGIVRWIDQAEDYRLRGDRTRTEEALREVFGQS
ncbi:MAG: peroxiredoxin [Hyphomicrobiaceae bacterium]|jgi:peroxiredoxin